MTSDFYKVARAVRPMQPNMRYLRSIEMAGAKVNEVLDGFNERKQDFGIKDETDIVSVSLMPSNRVNVHGQEPGPKATIIVVIVYWSKV
jgi:hypothetical protein